jgi:hypothetical protein
MTPKEKAKILVGEYFDNYLLFEDLSFIQAKQCALIAIDELIDELSGLSLNRYEYFNKVKQEIEKL